MDSDRTAAIALVISTVLIISAAATPSGAHPLNNTDHSVPEEVFHTLWSGDRDGGTNGTRLGGDSATGQLANGTDIPLDSPIRAVERWNRGDHNDFPATDRFVSIHPPGANRRSGRFIRDAYTAIFTVQPSTRARLSPTTQPLYVAPEGKLRGTVDYRVVVPPDDTVGDTRVNWSLQSHRIRKTKLLVDGRATTVADGSHTPALSYELQGHSNEDHRLTLTANISATLRKEISICLEHDEDGECTDWWRSVRNTTENITVRDSTDVVKYDLAVSGFIARYPSGDLGLVVYKNQPWLGYRLPNGNVRGVWRFYSARDTDWDTLVYSSRQGYRTTHSPLHPLQIHAYPVKTGPTPFPRRNVTILDVYGTSTESPTLPSSVNLDVLTQPYTASYGIATRAATTERMRTVRAWGLVRGVETTQSTAEFARVTIHESNLTLSVLNQTDESVTVRAALRASDSRTAINTAERDGYVVVNGQRLNTTGNGTVTTTIERPPGGVSARYEPGHWWLNIPGYTGDSDTVLLQGSVLRFISTLFRIGAPVSLFFLAVLINDRITGWRVWPPWRQI